MSWLGQNGASREDFMGLADAYASMYKAADEADETTEALQEDGEQQELQENPIGKMVKRAMNNVYTKGAATGAGAMHAGDKIQKAFPDRKARGSGRDGRSVSEETEALEEGNPIGKAIGNAIANTGAFTTSAMAGAGGYQALKDNSRKARGSGKDGMKKEEVEILDALQDAYAMMYEKKKDSDKCGEGTYWDSEDKKCKKKKSSSKTVIVGRGGYYGGGHHHGGSGSDGGGDGETDGGDGGETGGGDGGGGGE